MPRKTKLQPLSKNAAPPEQEQEKEAPPKRKRSTKKTLVDSLPPDMKQTILNTDAPTPPPSQPAEVHSFGYESAPF